MDIIGKRYWLLGVSAVIILFGIVALVVWGLPLSIDFRGGTLLQLQFPSGQAPQPAEVTVVANGLGIKDALVQDTAGGIVMIRSSELSDQQRTDLIDALSKKYSQQVTLLTAATVTPVISQVVTQRATIAVIVSTILVGLFVVFSFRKVENAFRYGVCAVAALVHDLLIIFGITAIGGHFLGWQADSLFLTAVLTVIAFSMQDTIVVFDRIRENSTLYRRLDFEQLVNHSVVQTLARSINTQLMTSDFLLLAMALFGGITLQQFVIILLVGMVSGTYSSIFIAASILVIWQNKEWKNWFGRRAPQPAS